MVEERSHQDPIMKMEEFNIGLLEKDRVPGLLIRFDENGFYNIGIQISDSEVVKVDSATENDAIYKIQHWADKVNEVQDQHKNR